MGASVHVVLEANWLLANGMNGTVWDLKVCIGGCWVEDQGIVSCMLTFS